MLKVLDARVHGALDYLLAAAFIAAPALFDFPYPAAMLAYITGVLYVGASLFTRYPLAIVGLLPLPLHGVLESLMAFGWIAMPWVFDFARDAVARNFFVLAGVGLLAVVLLTDYRSTSARVYRGDERRRTLVDRRRRARFVRHERRLRGERRAYGAA